MSETTLSADQLPWIIFELDDHYFAVNTKYVTGIIMMPSEIMPIPDAPEIFKGVADIRGTIHPLLDLRVLFGIKSVAQEYVEFKEMIDQRMLDHKNWVNELKRCLENNEPFRLATDPHNCAFGKWYYSFSSRSNVISNHLKKIEEPHAKLHELAERAFSCKRDCANCTNERCLRELLSEASDIYVPKIEELLKQTKDIFASHYREMVITLSNETKPLGIIVDEVVSVDSLEMVADKKQIHQLHRSPYVCGVAVSPKIQGEIIIIDEDVLISERTLIEQEENSLSELGQKQLETN